MNANDSTYYNAAQQIPLLATLPTDEKEALCALCSIVSARSGEFIFREHSPSDAIFFIIDGQVKVCRTDSQGKEVILALLGKHAIFGEMAVLNSDPRTADVIALLPCTLLRVSQKDFIHHLERWPGLSLNLLKDLSKRLHRASNRITDLALYDVCCRLARTLLSESVVMNIDNTPAQIVNPRPTHQTLASMIGTSREAVSRALKKLEQDGHIEHLDDRLIVHSLPT